MVGIFLCDVQGTGVRAALGTALIRGIVQEIADFGMDPGAYLTRMNHLLAPLLHQERVPFEVRACYLVLDVSTGKIRLANAGHLLPILIRQGKTQWLFENPQAQGPALVVEPTVTYPTVECTIVPDDRVVLFTDGLYAVKDKDGRLYGEEGILASAAKHAGEPLAMLFKSLEADACLFSSSGAFLDDVCLVGLQFSRFVG